MSTINLLFRTELGLRQASPAVESILRYFGDREHDWEQGSGDCSLERGDRSILGFINRPPFGLALTYDEVRPEFSAIVYVGKPVKADPDEDVSTYLGGEMMRIPRRYFHPPMSLATVVSRYINGARFTASDGWEYFLVNQ